MVTIAGGIVLGFIAIILLITGLWVVAIGAVFAYELYKMNKPLVWGLIGIAVLLIMVRLNI